MINGLSLPQLDLLRRIRKAGGKVAWSANAADTIYGALRFGDNSTLYPTTRMELNTLSSLQKNSKKFIVQVHPEPVPDGTHFNYFELTNRGRQFLAMSDPVPDRK